MKLWAYDPFELAVDGLEDFISISHSKLVSDKSRILCSLWREKKMNTGLEEKKRRYQDKYEKNNQIVALSSSLIQIFLRNS